MPRFQYCYNLKEIVIPKTVTETAHNAFSGCGALQSIVFENGGTELTLGVQIFQNRVSLTSITLPDYLTNIGLYPFDGAFDSHYCPYLCRSNHSLNGKHKVSNGEGETV